MQNAKCKPSPSKQKTKQKAKQKAKQKTKDKRQNAKCKMQAGPPESGTEKNPPSPTESTH